MAQSKGTEGQPAAGEHVAQSGQAADAIGRVDAGDMPAQPKEGSLKEADKTAGPFVDDADANDPPVRTNRPDVPIMQTLKVGAGAHRPPDPDVIGPDGRLLTDEEREARKAASA